MAWGTFKTQDGLPSPSCCQRAMALLSPARGRGQGANLSPEERPVLPTLSYWAGTDGGRSLRTRVDQELPRWPRKEVVGRRAARRPCGGGIEKVLEAQWQRGGKTGFWGWLGKGAGVSLGEEGPLRREQRGLPSSPESPKQGGCCWEGGEGGAVPGETQDPCKCRFLGPHLPDAAEKGVGHEAVVLVAGGARGHHQGQQRVGAGQRLKLPYIPKLLQGGGPRVLGPRALRGRRSGHLLFWKTGRRWVSSLPAPSARLVPRGPCHLAWG